MLPQTIIYTYIYITLSVLFGNTLAKLLLEANIINAVNTKTSKILGKSIHPELTPIPLLYLISPRAAHAHASQILKQGLVKPIDLYIALLASDLFLRIMYIYRYYIPLMLPLLGIIALYFIALRIIFDIILFTTVTIYGIHKYKNTNKNTPAYQRDIRIMLTRKTLVNSIKMGAKDTITFLYKFTPLYILIAVLMNINVFSYVTSILKPYLKRINIDSLGLTYLITAITSPRIAWGIAKIMIDNGYYFTNILGCIFLGNALYLLLNELWVRIIPFYISIYPKNIVPKLILLRAILPATYNMILGILLLEI